MIRLLLQKTLLEWPSDRPLSIVIACWRFMDVRMFSSCNVPGNKDRIIKAHQPSANNFDKIIFQSFNQNFLNAENYWCQFSRVDNNKTNCFSVLVMNIKQNAAIVDMSWLLVKTTTVGKLHLARKPYFGKTANCVVFLQINRNVAREALNIYSFSACGD